jgi:hypothetical protein
VWNGIDTVNSSAAAFVWFCAQVVAQQKLGLLAQRHTRFDLDRRFDTAAAWKDLTLLNWHSPISHLPIGTRQLATGNG